MLTVHSVNEEVIVRLKWGQTEYKGRLVSIDSYMNIQLTGAEEYIDQKMTSALGQVLIRYASGFSLWIASCSNSMTDCFSGPSNTAREKRYLWIVANCHRRCNNVLWIQGANQSSGNGDVRMEG